MLKIITTQLSEHLPKNHKLQKYPTIDPTNFKTIFSLFNSTKNKDLYVYDATISKKLIYGQTVIVNDHINNTGTNILIGKQNKLNIDFTDLTNMYIQNKNGIITTCCGEKLNVEKKYPCHYLCNITTMARAMQFNTITGCLYNIKG